MELSWSRGYQQGHWGPRRRVGEPTSNKGQCHGSNVYDQVRPHRSKEGSSCCLGRFFCFIMFFFFLKFVFVFFLKVTWVAWCVFLCPKLVQSRGGKLVPKGGVQSYLLYLAESSWSHVRSWPIWQWKRRRSSWRRDPTWISWDGTEVFSLVDVAGSNHFQPHDA